MYVPIAKIKGIGVWESSHCRITYVTYQIKQGTIEVGMYQNLKIPLRKIYSRSGGGAAAIKKKKLMFPHFAIIKEVEVDSLTLLYIPTMI